jgi:hypothetical protein
VAELFTQESTWERLIRKALFRRLGSNKRKADRARYARFTKRREHAACTGCGQEFENRSRGWLRKFCTDACRRAHHNRQQTLERRLAVGTSRTIVCFQCSTAFVVPLRSGNPKRFCSKKCKNKASKKPPRRAKT